MRQIGFKNFRRFEDFPMLNLGDITILVGRNNAGKSTMIKAILLLLDNLKYTPNNLRAISNGDIPEFHFDASQPHNAHIGTFTRALNNKAAKDELILEATFTDIKYDRTSNSNREINFTISITISGDKSINSSTARITCIRVVNNIDDTKFVFDFEKNTMSVAIKENAHRALNKDAQKTLKHLSELKELFKKEDDPIAVAELSKDIKDLEKIAAGIKKNTTLKDFEVHTSLRIFKYIDNFDLVSNCINAFSDYCEHPIEVKNKKSKEYKCESDNKQALQGYATNFSWFAYDVFTTIRRKEIEYIHAHAASQKVLFSIEDQNDYLAKTLHEFYKANIESGETAHRFLTRWLKLFRIGTDIKIETIEGEGYMAEIMHQDGCSRHLADLGTGSVQLVILLLKLTILVKKYGGVHLDEPIEELQNFGYYGPKDLDYEGPKPMVIIEEPEQNLHPAIQSQLAELFYYVSAKYGIRFIIETHSEYLIRRSQVIVADNNDEKWVNPFAVYYFPDDDTPYAMEYRKDGKFSNEFGTGFFDEASNLAFKIF